MKWLYSYNGCDVWNLYVSETGGTYGWISNTMDRDEWIVHWWDQLGDFPEQKVRFDTIEEAKEALIQVGLRALMRRLKKEVSHEVPINV